MRFYSNHGACLGRAYQHCSPRMGRPTLVRILLLGLLLSKNLHFSLFLAASYVAVMWPGVVRLRSQAAPLRLISELHSKQHALSETCGAHTPAVAMLRALRVSCIVTSQVIFKSVGSVRPATGATKTVEGNRKYA